jgi:hypothetical protein
MSLFTTQNRPKNRNRPVGPLAHSALREPGLVVGLGRESCFPPGPRLGPVILSRPSASDGRALIPAEQNPLWRSRANPSVHSFSPLPLPRHSERATELVGRRATQREERKCARGAVLSPSLVCAPTIGWTRHHRVASQRRLFASARTDEVASVGSDEVSSPCAHPQVVRRRDLESDHAPTSSGSGSTRAAHRSTADGGLRGETSKCLIPTHSSPI